MDNSESETSDALLEYLSSSHEVEVMNNPGRDYLEEQVKNGAPAVEVISDERAVSAVQLKNEISKFLIFANAQFNGTGSLDRETLQTALTDTVNVELNNDKVNDTDENYTDAAAYWLMLFIMLSVGNLMSEYNKPELQKRIISAPVYSFQLNCSATLPSASQNFYRCIISHKYTQHRTSLGANLHCQSQFSYCTRSLF